MLPPQATMKTIQPFRKCHLQILRSLYVGQDGDTAQEHQGDGTSLGAAINDGDGIGNGENERSEETNNNAETKHGCKEMSNDTEGAAMDKDNDSEGLVGSEIWDLIERFLQRRMEYPPHKERQIHWTEINAEAQSRLDHLVSITSSVEEEKILPMQSRSSSLTPRTPLFSVSGRGSMTPSMSLTPQSSNRNAPKLSQKEREMAITIPAWNIINQMLQRRSKLCTNSCQSFRSQPYLARLRNEADMRCNILERVMERLKVGTSGKHQNEKKREGTTIRIPLGKRQKLEIDVTRPTIPSSLGHFFSNEYSSTLTRNDRDARDDEICLDEDSIMETQMKLCLWSSLLSSVKEIVDES
mmetsp:Transcript_505/g.1121  ORF Transcript_505/g.1121 Transcript_505/m.1121 type:complete len:354 (+) Transcript_505:256-1317(+)